MNYYLIAKFIHIVGALGMFVTLGVEWLSLWNLRHAVSKIQVDAWLHITRGVQRLGGASMAAILISGFYMMAVARIYASWLVAAFVSLILLGVLAARLTGRHMKAIQQSMDMDSEAVSSSLSSAASTPALDRNANTSRCHFGCCVSYDGQARSHRIASGDGYCDYPWACISLVHSET